jgi:hypothetical protein
MNTSRTAFLAMALERLITSLRGTLLILYYLLTNIG